MSTFNARAVLFLVAVAALSGCGKVTPSNALANASDADAAAAVLLEPGRWELAISIERDFVRPFGSAPPTDPAREPRSTSASRTMTVCITPELAGNPGPVLITASDAVDGCQKTNWRMKGGSIDGDLTCSGASPGVPLRVIGSYTRTRFDSEATQGGSVGFTYRQKVSAKRVGTCAAGDRPTWTPRSFSGSD